LIGLRTLVGLVRDMQPLSEGPRHVSAPGRLLIVGATPVALCGGYGRREPLDPGEQPPRRVRIDCALRE